MSNSAASLERLFDLPSGDSGIDRKALAGLLVELARNVEPESRARAAGVTAIDPRLEQLRVLLLGREIEILSRLSALIEDPERLAEAVGHVLPTAIAHATSDATSDARLGQVLAPTVEKAAQSSIRSDPRTLVNILHPLIVPAIRKSIGEAIDQTFQSLNESLKHSLSWRGVKWRWEAWRTGTTFAEVILKHSLVYQVEHVFLIHQHTGLLISHVTAEDAASQDPQLVSSMLVAIQDFVRDSFGGAEQQSLDTLRLGELTLWSERGPFATLVAVIRGNPPEALHETLRSTLTRIHAERRQALEAFDGDSSGFADIEAHLAELAALRQLAPQQRRRRIPRLLAFVILVALLLVAEGGWNWWQDQRLDAAEQRRWAEAVARLRTEPGIVVTEASRHDGRLVLSGLRDPLAVDPEAQLREAGFDPRRLDLRWAPYEALDPEFVLQRLKASLEPPPSVSLAIQDGRIVATGSAPARWLERARFTARTLPSGSPGLDLYGVSNTDEVATAKLLQATKSLRDAIQSREIHFDSNEPLPAPGQDGTLDQLAREVKELAMLAASLHVPARVTLTGHSDDTGRGTFNLSLSQARADAVSTLLKKRGVDPNLLAARGAGPLDPVEAGSTDSARSANRRVSISVGIEGQQ